LDNVDADDEGESKMKAMRWRNVLVTLAVLVGWASVVGADSALDMTGASVNTVNYPELSCGWEFTPKENLLVTGLGYYAAATTLNYSHAITIYDAAGNVEVSGTVGSGSVTPDPDGYAYVDVSAQDVQLNTGQTYVIASYWTRTGSLWDLDIQSASGYAVATDCITLGELDLQSSGQVMPTDLGGTTNKFLSANFQFELETLPIDIDIKPGNDDNVVNIGSNGVIPVAILSDAEFDALSVDAATVQLQGKAGVRVKGNGNPLAVERDVNSDRLVDLEVKIEATNLEPGDIQGGIAEITGFTTDGQKFLGTDSVTIVPPE
jgi:hypothetical protein